MLHKLYPGVEKIHVDHHGSREKNMILFFFVHKLVSNVAAVGMKCITRRHKRQLLTAT